MGQVELVALLSSCASSVDSGVESVEALVGNSIPDSPELIVEETVASMDSDGSTCTCWVEVEVSMFSNVGWALYIQRYVGRIQISGRYHAVSTLAILHTPSSICPPLSTGVFSGWVS
jgi:hypothetical protein